MIKTLHRNTIPVKAPRSYTSLSEKDGGAFRSHDLRGTAKQTRPGFTLLISVLVASVLLALGFAIYNIVSKEIILSSAGRESQFAFYAADTGIECALYWDFVGDAFSIGSLVEDVVCGEAGVVSELDKVLLGDTITTTFQFSLGAVATDPCAVVSIQRTESPIVSTRIESLGYNTCVDTNPRRIERAIRVQY